MIVGTLRDPALPEPPKGKPVVPNIRGKIKIVVRDADGRILDYREEEMHSFVSNFLSLLYALFGLGPQSAEDTSGTVISIGTGAAAAGAYFSIMAGSGVDTYGIVVGSGSQTVSASVFKLAAQIPNGTGSGQLYYQAMQAGSLTVSGSTTTFTFSRTFVNNSGATITVSEIGVILYVYEWNMTVVSTGSTQTSDYFLIIYDVPSSAISVPNGASVTITYTIEVSA